MGHTCGSGFGPHSDWLSGFGVSVINQLEDDCPSIPPNAETQMMFDPDMSNEADDADKLSDAYLADRHQHLGTFTSTMHPGY